MKTIFYAFGALLLVSAHDLHGWQHQEWAHTL